MNKILAAAVGAGALCASAANATVIYQSIPDLTIAPNVNGYCSQCASNGQNIGQSFTLASAAVANTLAFAVTNYYFFPTPVTVDIFTDVGGMTLGVNLYHATFSTFVSDVDTGNATDVVTVNLGNVALAAGSYDLFLTNPSNLGIPNFSGGIGGIVNFTGSGVGPATGDRYSGGLGGASGVILSSGAVPEPAAWVLMVAGFGMVGTLARRRTAAVTA